MQDMREQIFRKVALERLSSPEQLDQLVPAMPAHAWPMFVPLLVLVLLALTWGWFGSLPTLVTGRAILVNPSGLADVVAPGSGRISGLSLRPGDAVRAGQVLARVVQPEIADRIEKARARLDELRAVERAQAPSPARSSAADAQTQNQRQLAAERERMVQLRRRLATQQQLFAEGLITQRELLATRAEISAAEQGVEAQRLEAERALDSLLSQEQSLGQVTAPGDGRVVEVKSSDGAPVQAGQSIVVIERQEAVGQRRQLVALTYVPAAEGKRVAADMEARIVPSTAQREVHGFVLGRVDTVSRYPVTPAGMQQALQNEALVRELTASGVPVEIRITLQRAETDSGYHWSTERGAAEPLATGTPAAVEIVVERVRPLALLLPFLKKSLGLS